jgi:hypothetical protein
MISSWLWEQIKKHRLYRDGTPPAMFTGAFISTASLAGAFLISIPLSFVTHYSYVCWVLIPLLSRAARALQRRRALSHGGRPVHE